MQKKLLKFNEYFSIRKNIFLAILGNENGIADFIANKCKEIKDLGSVELKESVEEFMLSDRMHEMLSKRIALNADEASYYLFSIM